jgi:hypothetical protein
LINKKYISLLWSVTDGHLKRDGQHECGVGGDQGKHEEQVPVLTRMDVDHVPKIP